MELKDIGYVKSMMPSPDRTMTVSVQPRAAFFTPPAVPRGVSSSE